MKLALIIVALIAVYLILWALAKQVRTVLKIIINGSIGCGVIYAMNILLAPLGFYIGINPVTYAVCGLLGISGFCALIGIQLVI